MGSVAHSWKNNAIWKGGGPGAPKECMWCLKVMFQKCCIGLRLTKIYFLQYQRPRLGESHPWSVKIVLKLPVPTFPFFPDKASLMVKAYSLIVNT